MQSKNALVSNIAFVGEFATLVEYRLNVKVIVVRTV